MTGHGGFFNVLSMKNTVISIFSLDEEYEAGNLFGNGVLAQITSEIIR